MEGRGIIVAIENRLIGDWCIRTLNEINPKQTITRVNNGLDTMDLLKRSRPALVIIDLFLPYLNGLAIMKYFQKQNIKFPFLCCGRRINKRIGVRAVKAGAKGIVDASISHDELIHAIRSVMRGGNHIPQDVQILLDENDFEFHQPQYTPMTIRQIQVIQMVVKGYSNDEIGYILNISTKAVEKHKRLLRDKFGLNTAWELGFFAIREGFIQIHEEELKCL